MLARISTVLAAALFSVIGAAAAAADPPKIERLFPPGGQIGSTVTAKVIGAGGDGDLQVWSDRQQLHPAFNEKRDEVTITIPQDAAPGLHRLRFWNQHGSTAVRPFVVGLLPEATETEAGNNVEDAIKIDQMPVTMNGVLEKNQDVDVFAVSLKQGTTFVASVQAHPDLGSPMDASLQLLNAEGTVIASNDDDHGNDPLIAFPVTHDTTAFVRIFAFPASPDSSIRLASGANYVYRLTLTDGPFIDHVVPPIVARSGQSAEIVGWNLDSAAVQIQTPPFEGDRTRLHGLSGLALQLRASGIEGNVRTEDVKNSPIVLPMAIGGVISAKGEIDEFSFDRKKDQKVLIRVSAAELGSQLDPVLTLIAPDGKILKEVDDQNKDNVDAELDIALKSDGRYRLTIQDRFASGSWRHFYVLMMEESRPDFDATVGDGEFVLSTDKDLEIPVTIIRLRGFQNKITVTATGLPEGVTAAPVVSEKEGDSTKKVTLKITGTQKQPSWSGPIRIICQPESDLTPRTATLAVKDTRDRVNDLWLTVLPRNPDESAQEPSP
ncbi:MAG: PPC domain-containing protein [Planctomycetaceae bacterium]